MNIALITGASSGLGKQYAFSIARLHPEIEEFWLIARRGEQLEKVGSDLGRPFRALALDITKEESIDRLAGMLAELKPRVGIFINNAGFGRLGNFIDMPRRDVGGMVRLNCEALTEMASAVLPYVPSGGFVINTCSISAFVPNPRMAVYSATKAYVFSLSKALRYELKPRGVNVLAVCPAPMDTEFLEVAGITGHSKTFDRLPHVDPERVARNSLIAAARGRAVYTEKAFYRFYRVLGKLLPHNLLMPAAKC